MNATRITKAQKHIEQAVAALHECDDEITEFEWEEGNPEPAAVHEAIDKAEGHLLALRKVVPLE